MIQEQVRRFLSEQSPLSMHRSVMEGEALQATEVWRGLAELGLQGTAIPEAYGGVGAGYLPLCLVAQELGAVLAAVPFSSSIYLAAEAITCFGSTDQKERYLPKLASGEWIGTLALSEGPEAPTQANLKVARSADTLSGKKLVVPHGLAADFAVVLVASAAGTDLVIAGLEGVERVAIEIVDPTIAAASLHFEQAQCEGLGNPGEGWAMLETLQHRAAVLYAFEQIGGAEQALNMAVAYAKERFAFGRPIGSFQALKHMMADMYVALKLAESNAYYAAWALQNDAPDLQLSGGDRAGFRNPSLSAVRARQHPGPWRHGLHLGF